MMRMFDVIRKQPVRILVLLFTICTLASEIQGQSSARERANALRQQLIEIQTKRQSLETRLTYLAEELKPENIEKRLAGTGSTRPEDLRELRRRQLENEKANIQSQQRLLAESQTRLETSIVQAEADAYHQSAGTRLDESQQPSAKEQPASVSNVQGRERRTRRIPKR